MCSKYIHIHTHISSSYPILCKETSKHLRWIIDQKSPKAPKAATTSRSTFTNHPSWNGCSPPHPTINE